MLAWYWVVILILAVLRSPFLVFLVLRVLRVLRVLLLRVPCISCVPSKPRPCPCSHAHPCVHPCPLCHLNTISFVALHLLLPASHIYLYACLHPCVVGLILHSAPSLCMSAKRGGHSLGVQRVAGGPHQACTSSMYTSEARIVRVERRKKKRREKR